MGYRSRVSQHHADEVDEVFDEARDRGVRVVLIRGPWRLHPEGLRRRGPGGPLRVVQASRGGPSKGRRQSPGGSRMKPLQGWCP